MEGPIPATVGRRLLAPCLIVGAALAGCSGAPGPDDEEVLLLGYGSGSPGGAPGDVETYQTLALLFSGDSVRVVGAAPDVIIPLASGFARLGVATRCDYDSTTGMIDYHQEVRRTEDEGPIPREGRPCRGEPAGLESRPGVEGATLAGEEEPPEPPVCGDVHARILFASPGFWAEAVTSGQFEDCEPRGDRYATTYRVREATRRGVVSLRAVFDSATAAAAYRRAMVEGFDAVTREGWNCPEPPEDFDDLTSWAITHERGAWRALAAVGAGFYGGCQFSHEMALPLPDSLTGAASTGEPWPALNAAVPDLRDYVVSPRGTWAVAMVGAWWDTKIVAYPMRRFPVRKAWEGPAMSILDLNIVIARWGDGRDARRWGELLAGLRGSPPGSPRIDSGPAR